ncbi:MAG: S41 family peptidase [Candidatus Aenigmarchaeota archaeon]|nr:S41 family peptidase [Candidatus Aenigmarchaeota archaeon]
MSQQPSFFKRKYLRRKSLRWLIVVIVFMVGIVIGISGQGIYQQIVQSRQLTDDQVINWQKRGFNFNIFEQVWQLMQKKFINQPLANQKLFHGALSGMVNSLDDPYSIFLDPELFTEFQNEIAGTFEGIGAEIGIKNDLLTIIAPLSDSPAELAGLKAGDKVYAIDETITLNMFLEQAVNLIRGPKGSEVVLTIGRTGWDEAKDIMVTRNTINVEPVKYEIKDKNIGYIKVVRFGEKTIPKFRTALEQLKQQHVDKIILDLRNNPGGYLETGVDLTSFWLSDQVVVKEEFADGQIKEYRARGNNELADYQTVILVNQGSASASEIVAGALQDWNKATIIGETTFGKGSVQELTPLIDGSAIKLTVAYWLTPKNRLINEAGIVPDIDVELTIDDYNQNLDPQLAKAIKLLNN